MAVFVIMAAAGMLTGMIGGGMATGTPGMVTGAAAGLIIGSFTWGMASTAAQVRRERRLNRYFEEAGWEE